MHTSDYIRTINTVLKSTVILLTCSVVLIWLNQRSLEQYWALHFHQDSPWASFRSSWWARGGKVTDAAVSAENVVFRQLAAGRGGQDGGIQTQKPASLPMVTASQPVVAVNIPPPVRQIPENDRQLSRLVTVSHTENDGGIPERGEAASVTPVPALSSPYDSQGKALLPAGKKVLLIGDSMMEGVAPRVQQMLRQEYHTQGINLSRRSTGLAYPGFFNWPVTTENALENHPDIGLLVVFLGPNDPWDMPVARNRPFLKFRSEAWEAEYRHRIEHILNLGQTFHIPVIWLLPPNMRKSTLSQNMAWLDTLYASEVGAAGGIVVSVNRLFGYPEGVFSPTADLNGKRVHVRAGDGIHYTPAGESLIAKAIIAQIHFEQLPGEVSDEE